MTAEEIKRYNRSYLGLNEVQYAEHVRLMEMKMSDRPQKLIAYCKQQSRICGACGDTLAVWCADYIKANGEAPL